MKHIIFLAIAVLTASIAQGEPFSHDKWDTLLQRHVEVHDGGKSTSVNYNGMAGDSDLITEYLEQMALVSQEQLDSWAKDDQLAFLINAYNAWTVELILTGYPDIASIKDLGSLFQSPWKKKLVTLLGKKRSLDDLEHGLIRGSGRYNEPRIHFAVNCASIGCPALKNEAYRGDLLERQLEEATSLFLSDRTRNRLKGNTVEISSIFKWYREDFEKGWRGANTLHQFLALYKDSLGLKNTEAERLAAGDIAIEFPDYDWKLNDTK